MTEAGKNDVKTVRLLVGEQDHSVMLTFEFWAEQYLLAANTAIVVEFDDGDPHHPVEVVHGADGITFFSSGRFPRLWTQSGEEIEI